MTNIVCALNLHFNEMRDVLFTSMILLLASKSICHHATSQSKCHQTLEKNERGKVKSFVQTCGNVHVSQNPESLLAIWLGF